MKLLFGTNNHMKFDLMKKRLKPLKDIELVSPKELNIKVLKLKKNNSKE